MTARICMNCKWIEYTPLQVSIYAGYIPAQYQCRHPKTINLVTGEIGKSAIDMRAAHEACDVDGKLFEEKA